MTNLVERLRNYPNDIGGAGLQAEAADELERLLEQHRKDQLRIVQAEGQVAELEAELKAARQCHAELAESFTDQRAELKAARERIAALEKRVELLRATFALSDIPEPEE